MPDFLKQLPYDITCFIFSFISQRDCIECMRVNHSWNEMIPSAISPNLWTVLDISGGSWRKRSACLLPFLGYVRTLYITPSSKMDRELVNIKSNGCTVVNSLVLHGETSNYPGKDLENRGLPLLLRTLQVFGDTLTKLRAFEFVNDIQIVRILAALPHLTHLELYPASEVTGSLPISANLGPRRQISEDENVIPSTLKLEHLLLNSRLDWGTRIMPIVRHCPLLESFVLCTSIAEEEEHGGRRNDLEFIINHHNISFQNVLDVCPRLKCLVCNLMVDSSAFVRKYNPHHIPNIPDIELELEMQKSTKHQQDQPDDIGNDKGGLRAFYFQDDGAPSRSDTVANLLHQTQNTLQHLEIHRDIKGIIRNFHSDWSFLCNIYLSQLQRVKFISNKGADMCLYTQLITNHARTLQEVSIELISIPFTRIMCQAIAQVDKLSRLEICSRNQQNRGPYMSSFYDDEDSEDDSELNAQQNRGGLAIIFKNCRSLKEIILTNMHVTDDELACTIGSLPLLEKLSINTLNSYTLLTSGGLLSFIEKIKSNNKNAFKHLVLRHINAVDDTVLAALSTISSLKTLELDYNKKKMTDTGLRAFVDSSIGIHLKLFRLSVDYHDRKNLTLLDYMRSSKLDLTRFITH